MRFLYSLLGLFALLWCVLGQNPIPNRPDGYACPKGGDGNSPVVLEIFVDLLCPDSATAWPTINSVIDSYDGQVRLVTHLFPLPYHTWAFIVNQGAFVIDQNTNHNVSAVYEYFDFAFDIQSQFGNAATATLSSNQIVSNLANAVSKQGILSAQAFTKGINDGNLNWDARVAWKYACSRSITGTPSFLINGVFINADITWTVSDWQNVIDPILNADKLRYLPKLKASDCPSNTTTCEYIKGQIQCCPPSEMCIPNVGCRC